MGPVWALQKGFQVIPAKGHANVVLSFTPYPTSEVPKDMAV